MNLLQFLDEDEALNEFESAWLSKDWEAVDKLCEQFKEPAENELFDILNKITADKVHVNVASKESYSKFWIDNALSQHVDCIDSVYIMNLIGANMSDQDHFNYYFHSIRQGKRYGKWAKLVQDPEQQVVIALIQKRWAINQYDAMMYEEIIKAKGLMEKTLKVLKPLATKEFVASVIKQKADQTKVNKAITKW
ncbi:DNA polymerase accessory protein clamp loader subunit [Serratia phage 4S]|nr:DNA polymerase accessory protein clamp loader subunit [Serratia phage 4S]